MKKSKSGSKSSAGDPGYGKYDEKEGNIGEARLREIIKEALGKITKINELDQEEKVGIENFAVRQLFPFIKKEILTEEEVKSNFEEIKEIAFIDMQKKIKRFINNFISEATIKFCEKKEQELKELLIIAMEHQNENDKKYLEEVELQNLRNNFQQEQTRLLLERMRLENEIAHLRFEISKRKIRIAEEHAKINLARDEAANNILKRSNEIFIDGKNFFEGMNPEQRKLFVKGRLSALEMKTKKMAQLELEREEAIVKLSQDPAKRDTQTFWRNKINQDYDAQKAEIIKEERDKIRELARQYGCKAIDPNANDKDFDKQMAKYDNHLIVKTEQEKFIKVADKGYRVIVKDEKEIKEFKQEINLKEKIVDKVDERLEKITEAEEEIAEAEKEIAEAEEEIVEKRDEILSDFTLDEVNLDDTLDGMDGTLDDMLDALDCLDDLEESKDNSLSLLGCEDFKDIVFGDHQISTKSSKDEPANDSKPSGPKNK